MKMAPLSLYVKEEETKGRFIELMPDDPLNEVQAYFETEPDNLRVVKGKLSQVIFCLDGLTYKKFCFDLNDSGSPGY
jgi:hypothetical protein